VPSVLGLVRAEMGGRILRNVISQCLYGVGTFKGHLLNRSDMKFRDQSKWNRGIESNAMHAPSSKDQLDATLEPHQNVSAKHVVRQERTTNPQTIQRARRSFGIVLGMSLVYNARMENLGK
jgi:hypothetical protein